MSVVNTIGVHGAAMQKRMLAALAIMFSLSFASAASAQLQCSGLSSGAPSIAGLYVDNFGGWHSVGKKAWVMPSGDTQFIFHICSVDNAKHFIIALNSPGNDTDPLKFSRFEWSEQNGQLFYCQQVFAAASSADAADFSKTPAADPADANDKGCGENGKFAWTALGRVSK